MFFENKTWVIHSFIVRYFVQEDKYVIWFNFHTSCKYVPVSARETRMQSA